MLTLREVTREWKKQKEKGVRIIAFGSSNTELHWHSLDPKIFRDKKEIARNLRMMKQFCDLPSRSSGRKE